MFASDAFMDVFPRLVPRPHPREIFPALPRDRRSRSRKTWTGTTCPSPGYATGCQGRQECRGRSVNGSADRTPASTSVWLPEPDSRRRGFHLRFLSDEFEPVPGDRRHLERQLVDDDTAERVSFTSIPCQKLDVANNTEFPSCETFPVDGSRLVFPCKVSGRELGS